MLSKDEVEEQLALLQAHRRTLALYLKQQADQGGSTYALPGIANGIADSRANIQHIKQYLRDSGVDVPDKLGDIEPSEAVDPQPPKKQGTIVRQPRLWLIGVFVGIAALIVLLVVRLQTGTATPGQSFTYSFSTSASDWRFANEADADKWKVVQVETGDSVYQGTAPIELDHQITAAPPNNDVIKEWQNYAVEMRVRVVHAGTDDHTFNIMVRGEDNADSGCWGYLFVFKPSQAQAEILLNGSLDKCPPRELASKKILFAGDQWFIIRMEAVGDYLRLYINNEEEPTLVAVDDVLSKGYFDMNVMPGATVQFDNIRIWEIVQ